MAAPSPLKTPFGFSPKTATSIPVAVPTENAPSGLLDQVKGTFARITKFRDELNLPNPGSYEAVNREVKRKLILNSGNSGSMFGARL